MQSDTALEEAVETRKQEQESYGIPPNELRLVLIGKTGNGKSSTANTIIGKKIFKTGAKATSITKVTDIHRVSRFGKKIILVDTPGLFDPEIERKETEIEMLRCMYMTLPGFNAFLLVVRIGRFTTEEMETVKEFEKLFGEKLYDFMIIVFTRMDDLVREDETLEDFVRSSDIPPNLKQIIERCNSRYVGLNNIDSPENKEKATKYLIEMIETMIDSKDPNHYTNEAFEKAEKDLREKIKAEKERMEAAKKAEFEEMFAEKENKMREEHAIQLEEMKGAWKEERQLQEENAKKRQEKEKENMEASFADELDKRLAEETEIRRKLLEDSERKTKEIQEEIQGIKDDNAELKGELEKKQRMEEDKINKLLEGIARKEKEEKTLYDKLKADLERERRSFQAKMLENEREWRQKEREKEMEMHAMHKQQLEEERNRAEAEHKRLIAEMSRPIVMKRKRKLCTIL